MSGSRGRPAAARTRAKRIAVASLIATLVIAATLASLSTSSPTPAEASHFRADQTTWRRTAPDSVEFTLTTSFRASYFGIVAPGETFSEGVLDFGDGNSAGITWTALTVDAANDVVTGRAVIPHTYADPGPFTATHSNCCRLGAGNGHINNPDGNIVMRTLVDLSTSGSPQSAISPIVACPADALCSFTVPAVHPDGGPLTFRLADGSDGFGNQPSGATIDPSTGRYSWDTTGVTVNADPMPTFYSTQVIVEKVSGGVVVGRIAVDFFIRIGGVGNAPYFDPPTPADGAVINGTVGSPITFDAHAHDDDDDVITMGILNLPTGASYVQDATPAGHGEATFLWTPTEVGETFVVLTAVDATGLAATQRAITLRVDDGAPPVAPPSTRPPGSGNPTTTTTQPGTTTSTTVPGTTTTRPDSTTSTTEPGGTTTTVPGGTAPGTTVPGGGGVYYQNCDAVRAAGRAPLYAGQPGYRTGLDSDRDGVACEDVRGTGQQPPPPGGLPRTGADLTGGLIGLTLVAFGAITLGFRRRLT